jgi:Txe/YoeB family toxin of Txe-Axe toxin-antitoxin module
MKRLSSAYENYLRRRIQDAHKLLNVVDNKSRHLAAAYNGLHVLFMMFMLFHGWQ